MNTKIKNITFLLPHLKIGGGIRVALSYASNLARLGHQVEILATDQSRLKVFLKNTLHSAPIWFPAFPKEIRISWVGSSAPLSKKIDSADVIICDSWLMADRVLKNGFTQNVFNLVQHDERLYHGSSDAVSKVYASGLEKIVVSSWLQETLKKDFNKNSHLLLNSFDRNLFYPASGASAERHSTFRILVLSHPYLWKGTKEAISIVQSLKRTYPRVRLVGFGARHSDFDALFDEFHFQPPQEELARLYGSTDLFLCTSWDEGFGLPSLEAMACGTPVVTYDNGGSRDFAHHNDTALVAPRQDKDTLQKYVERMIVDESLRTKLRENALRLTASWPTWEEQTKKLERIVCQTN